MRVRVGARVRVRVGVPQVGAEDDVILDDERGAFIRGDIGEMQGDIGEIYGEIYWEIHGEGHPRPRARRLQWDGVRVRGRVNG